jgi:6-phosphogluconolactonase
MTLTASRRSFLASAAAFPFALRSLAQSPASPRWVFLGTDKGPGITRCSWDPATGKLGAAELAIKTERPGFFALHPRLPRLYVANELMGAAACVSSFHVDAAGGALEFADKQSSMGDGPCYVSIDGRGQTAFVANYAGGSFAGYRLKTDGSLLPATASLDCRNNPVCGTQGPVHDRQDASHLHCAVISPLNDFVLACDLGNDSIEVFPIHPEALGRPSGLPPIGPAQRFEARPGSGPRHLVFHPNLRWVYVIHELDCTVELFDWIDHGPGQPVNLRRRDGTAISTLTPGTKASGDTGCEILVSPDGRFIYTCTRGANSLQVLSVNAQTGKLTEQQQLPCGGAVPRHIAFDPTRRWLLCANQSGSTVTVFAHDARTGKLSGPVQTLAADTPMFVQFI